MEGKLTLRQQWEEAGSAAERIAVATESVCAQAPIAQDVSTRLLAVADGINQRRRSIPQDQVGIDPELALEINALAVRAAIAAAELGQAAPVLSSGMTELSGRLLNLSKNAMDPPKVKRAPAVTGKASNVARKRTRKANARTRAARGG